MTTRSAPALRWHWRRFAELSGDELYDVLQLRGAVFVVEQACAYLDPDDKDRHPEALHLLGRSEDGTLAAYLRLLPPGLSFAAPSFGRVVTVPTQRGRGYGDALVAQALVVAARRWPMQGLQIGAQAHLAHYYAKHGFVVCSEPFLEDGIPHVNMRREPDAVSVAPQPPPSIDFRFP